MYKMLKVTAISVVAALVLAMPVFAQTSPTNTATAGVFTTDVENSMDVHRYSEVEFERWAGFLGHSGESDRPVSLGFATRFGGIHLGTWFTGNFANFDRVEGENVTTTYDLTNMIPIQRVTTTTFSDQVTRTNNQLHALIGVAGMGFRVGLHHDWETWSNPDRIITVTETLSGTTTTYMNQVDEFSRTTGSLIPTLEWGMNLAAGNLVIRPNVFLGFELYRDSEIFNTRPVFTTDNGNLVGNFTVERSGHNEGFMAPSFGVGAEIDLPSGENSTVTIGLSYGLGMRLFDNSFDDSGFSGSVNGTVSWGHGFADGTTIVDTIASTTTTTSSTLHLDEQTWFNHVITPSFRFEREIAERATFGLRAMLPVNINIRSNDTYEKSLTTSRFVDKVNSNLNTVTNSETRFSTGNGLTEVTTFSVMPTLNVGAIYALVPGRFNVSAGVSLTPLNFAREITRTSRGSTLATTTTTVYDHAGNVISHTVTTPGGTDDITSSVQAQNTMESFSATAAGGFTFYFGGNMAIDMVVNGGNPSGDFTMNFTNAHVLFRVKF